MPPEFKTMIAYSRNLEFKEEPNYDYLRSLMHTVARRENITMDYCYDWMQTTAPQPVVEKIASSVVAVASKQGTPSKQVSRVSISSMLPMQSSVCNSPGPMSPVSRKVSRARVSDFPPLLETAQYNETSVAL